MIQKPRQNARRAPSLKAARISSTRNFFKIWVSRIISMFRRVKSTCRFIPYLHTKGTEISLGYPSGTDFPYISHMGSPNDCGRKYGRKTYQNFTTFFFQKIDAENCSETQFRKNRTHRTDSKLYFVIFGKT